MPNEEKAKAAPEDRRWDELKFIQDSIYKVWSAYLVYLIWFHTAVYAVVSFLMGTGTKAPTTTIVLVSAIVVTISEGASFAVTVALGMYSKNALRRVEVIVKEGTFHAGLDPRVLLPARVINVTVPACLVSFVVGAVACLSVAFLALRS